MTEKQCNSFKVLQLADNTDVTLICGCTGGHSSHQAVDIIDGVRISFTWSNNDL